MCPVIAVTRAMAHASASSSTSRSYPTTVGRQPRASSARSVCMRARRPSFVEVSAASIDRCAAHSTLSYRPAGSPDAVKSADCTPMAVDNHFRSSRGAL